MFFLSLYIGPLGTCEILICDWGPGKWLHFTGSWTKSHSKSTFSTSTSFKIRSERPCGAKKDTENLTVPFLPNLRRNFHAQKKPAAGADFSGRKGTYFQIFLNLKKKTLHGCLRGVCKLFDFRRKKPLESPAEPLVKLFTTFLCPKSKSLHTPLRQPWQRFRHISSTL